MSTKSGVYHAKLCQTICHPASNSRRYFQQGVKKRREKRQVMMQAVDNLKHPTAAVGKPKLLN